KSVESSGPFAVRRRQSFDHAGPFARFLEGRIDEYQTTAFLGRHIGAERQPAVEFRDAGLYVVLKQIAELAIVRRVKLQCTQAILRTKKLARDQGRAG